MLGAARNMPAIHLNAIAEALLRQINLFGISNREKFSALIPTHLRLQFTASYPALLAGALYAHNQLLSITHLLSSWLREQTAKKQPKMGTLTLRGQRMAISLANEDPDEETAKLVRVIQSMEIR